MLDSDNSVCISYQDIFGNDEADKEQLYYMIDQVNKCKTKAFTHAMLRAELAKTFQ